MPQDNDGTPRTGYPPKTLGGKGITPKIILEQLNVPPTAMGGTMSNGPIKALYIFHDLRKFLKGL